MSVKGQELPGYDPRGLQGQGLEYATSVRGACHVYGNMVYPEVFGIPVKLDPSVDEGKAGWVKRLQDLAAALDSAGVCLFTFRALSAADYAAMVAAVTALPVDEESLLQAGERIWNLQRLFNARAGFSRKDDTLPPPHGGTHLYGVRCGEGLEEGAPPLGVLPGPRVGRRGASYEGEARGPRDPLRDHPSFSSIFFASSLVRMAISHVRSAMQRERTNRAVNFGLRVSTTATEKARHLGKRCFAVPPYSVRAPQERAGLCEQGGPVLRDLQDFIAELGTEDDPGDEPEITGELRGGGDREVEGLRDIHGILPELQPDLVLELIGTSRQLPPGRRCRT